MCALVRNDSAGRKCVTQAFSPYILTAGHCEERHSRDAAIQRQGRLACTIVSEALKAKSLPYLGSNAYERRLRRIQRAGVGTAVEGCRAIARKATFGHRKRARTRGGGVVDRRFSCADFRLRYTVFRHTLDLSSRDEDHSPVRRAKKASGVLPDGRRYRPSPNRHSGSRERMLIFSAQTSVAEKPSDFRMSFASRLTAPNG
mgnify:CR=1 FL=1